MFKEFKGFAMRGNVVDMAVGIIIGATFGAIVASFVGDVLMPANLMSALSSGTHGQYVDNPGILSHQSALTDGNGILGHLLGSKDVSREVANRAAAQTGLSADVLKRMLPLAASLMMGTLAKQSGNDASLAPGLGGSGGGIAAMLTPLLDKNDDGSIVDDVASMIGRVMKRS